ncbi:MAG: hypothetical protein ACK5MR_03305 [Cumulibacter sp.]
MTDRDTPGANSPDPDDVPREPSKAEIDDAIRARSDATPVADRSESTDEGDAGARAEFPAAPAIDERAQPEGRRTFPPSRFAVISGSILAAIMLGLMIFTFSQDVSALVPDSNRAQVEGTARLLEDQDVAEFTDDEIDTAKDAFTTAGESRDINSGNVADALNVAKPDSVTAEQIDDMLTENDIEYSTLESMESQFRYQAFIFGGVGVVMLLGTFFYQRAKSWARYIGMFGSGFISVMYLMQVMQGGMNVITLVLTVVGIATFWAFMKGRLVELPPMPGGRPRGGGLFAPRPKQ